MTHMPHDSSVSGRVQAAFKASCPGLPCEQTFMSKAKGDNPRQSQHSQTAASSAWRALNSTTPTASLLRLPGPARYVSTRRACEHQPLWEERVGFAAQTSLTIIHSQWRFIIGGTCASKSCGYGEVTTGTGGGCRWEFLVTNLHVGGLSVTVARCWPGATTAFVTCSDYKAALFRDSTAFSTRTGGQKRFPKHSWLITVLVG